jgi:formylglycine-generating enzyme required for sulfatase activity
VAASGKVPKPPANKPAAENPEEESPLAGLGDTPDAAPPARAAKRGRAAAQPGPAPWWRRRMVLAGGGVGAALLLILVGLWAAGVLRVKTKDGTIVLEDLPPDAEVLVDDQQVTVTWAGGSQAQVSVKPGTRRVQVTRGGIKVAGEQVLIEEGGQKVISAKWEPPAKAEAPPARPVADKPAADAKPPATFKNGIGMEFVLVPRGKVWLGGGGGKLGEQGVEITKDFYLGKYEVTQGEWQKVTGVNPSYFSRQGGGKDALKDIPDAELARFPVEGVSWNDAQLFLEALNAKEKESGWAYRLPTEAEWEYACRGGPTANKFDYAFDYYFEEPTNQMSPADANFEHPGGLKRPCKVGSYKPNRLGLYDMHGNVIEWCEDALTDPNGNPVRAMRGGCHFFPTWWCRAAARVEHPPSLRGAAHDTGLRVARVPASRELPAKHDAEGFVPLFNGKDTQGWHASEGTKASWRVEGGTLIGSGEFGYLITDRSDYENFRLRIEAKLGAGGDSGLCFRVQDPRTARAYEAQIGSGRPGMAHTGSFVILDGRGAPILAHAPQTVPPGQWFTMEVLAEGNRFTIWVDGQQTAQYEDKERRYARGAIAVQQIGPGSEVSFRKIEIKEFGDK